MSEFQTERCRSCGAPVIWARTTAGRLMPVDAAPDPAGNVLLSAQQGGDVPDAKVVSQGASSDQPLHVSHFARCPDAGKWRRTR